MLTTLITLSAFAAAEPAGSESEDASAADKPAVEAPAGSATAESYELISDKRELASLEAALTPVLDELGSCSAHTGGLDYGELTVSFMVDKKGKTANASVRSGYVLPKPLTDCLTAPIAEVQLGRGDVAVAKVVLTLP